MEQRPGMYDCKNVEDIFKFIQGYTTATTDYEVSLGVEVERFTEEFTSFVKAHYDMPSSHHNWSGIILYQTNRGSDSFDAFFKLFNQFIRNK